VNRRTIWYSIPFAIVLLYSGVWYMPSAKHLEWKLLGENHPIELITFFAMFIGGLLGLDLARRLWSAGGRWFEVGFYVFFSLGLLLIAMEEVAWGQWSFGFETPESIRWRNKQEEMTLHNLRGWQGNNCVLRLIFAGGGLLGWVLGRAAVLARIGTPTVLLPWLFVIGAMGGLEYLMDFEHMTLPERPQLLLQKRMPEVVEMMIGIAGLMYVMVHRRRLKRAVAPSETA
jgi:hypothetical protein